MYFYYVNLWAIFVVLPLCRDNCDYTVITQLDAMTIVGLVKLLVETQFTCGPNEAPGRNKVICSFTCEPNEAAGRN